MEYKVCWAPWKDVQGHLDALAADGWALRSEWPENHATSGVEGLRFLMERKAVPSPTPAPVPDPVPPAPVPTAEATPGFVAREGFGDVETTGFKG